MSQNLDLDQLIQVCLPSHSSPYWLLRTTLPARRSNVSRRCRAVKRDGNWLVMKPGGEFSKLVRDIGIFIAPPRTPYSRGEFLRYVLELARQPLSMNSAFKRSRSFLQEVGIILTQPQRVFHRLMDVGDSRMQWDTTFSRLSILDRVDKFTDTIELASGGKVFYRNNPSAQKASHWQILE